VRADALLALLVAAVALVPAGVATAAQAGVAVELRGGGLAADGPASARLPDVRLAGAPVTVEAPVGPFTVTDTRSAAGGWTLVATAGAPVDPRGVGLGAPLVLVPRPPAGAGGLTVGTVAPLDAPRALLAAGRGQGAGRLQVTPLLRLTVPADAPSAVYTATLTVTVA
jgi:hypothetical protein